MHGKKKKKNTSKVKTRKNDKPGEIFVGNIYHRISNITNIRRTLKNWKEKEKDSPYQLHRHVGHSAFSDRYEPAEDMFLLLDVLKAAAVKLTGMEMCLKGGVGSGVMPEFLASMIGPLALYMCSAVNPEAAVCTLETVCCNEAHTQPMITDFKRSTRDHYTFQTGRPRNPFSPQVHQVLICSICYLKLTTLAYFEAEVIS